MTDQQQTQDQTQPSGRSLGGQRASRRGQSKKRELKRTKKSVKKQLDSLHGSTSPTAHCRTRQWDTAYDDVNTVRVQFNTWHRGRQLIDFVIPSNGSAPTGGRTSSDSDCCHGCCHLHQDGRDGNDPLWQLDDERTSPGVRPSLRPGRDTCAYHPEQRKDEEMSTRVDQLDQLRHEVNLNLHSARSVTSTS